MTKISLAALILTLASLFAVSAALPSMLGRTMSTKAKPNIPRMLLGKPYRTRWDEQGCSSAPWTLAVKDRLHSDDDADTDLVFDHTSTHQVQLSNNDRVQMMTDTKSAVPLPLVLNTFPEFGSTRLRLMKSKRPVQHSPRSDDALPPEKTQSDGMNPRDEDQQRVQLPIKSVTRSENKQLSRAMSTSIRRSKRLYDKGEWKSRLFEY